MNLAKSVVAATAILIVALPFVASAKSAPRDVKTEEANRELVVEFYDRVFNKHEVADGAKVIVDSYKQHNPHVPDGKAPFVSYFTGFFKDNPEAKSLIVQSGAEDDLVWLHVHQTINASDRGLAIVDIFRVRDHKIVEHWDVIQQVPDTAANSNTMF